MMSARSARKGQGQYTTKVNVIHNKLLLLQPGLEKTLKKHHSGFYM